MRRMCLASTCAPFVPDIESKNHSGRPETPLSDQALIKREQEDVPLTLCVGSA
jgi:hypothetical protein